MKPVLILAICLCLLQGASAQKQFRVTIRLDSSINSKSIGYHYQDGQRLVSLRDTAKTGTVTFTGDYRAERACITLDYMDKAGTFYYNTFFVGDQPAQISLYYRPNTNQLLLHSQLINAWAPYDTLTNKVYREIVRDNSKHLDTWLFFKKYEGRLNSSDSLSRIYNQMMKTDRMRTMYLLKKYPDDYFAFWYFQHQLVALRERTPDIPYLTKQLAFYRSTFAPKFGQSYEGHELAQAFDRALNPLNADATAPAFTVSTIDGKSLSLAALKGRYVLLDFWATWCAPCMKELPFIKSLRNTYPADKLAIIGISRDTDLGKLKATITREGMNWNQYFDKEARISRLYGVDVFPTLVLLNKEGKIIYKSDYSKDDTRELPGILKGEL